METVEYIDGIKIITVINEPIEEASAQERAEREAICYACDKYSNGVCSECSCILELRTRYKIMFCPIGKW
jgi:hypothetical protein